MKGDLSKNHLYSLTWFRGIASMMVCLFHFNHYVWPNGSSNFFLQMLEFGHIGVYIFFVISGFIIPYSMYFNQYEWSNLKQFIVKRTVRIEPPYIGVIILILFWDWFCRTHFWNMTFELNWKQIFFNVTYLAPFFKIEWINTIFWTLAIEFQFYILMGILLPILLKNKVVKYICFIGICALGFVINSNYNTVFHNFIYFIIGFQTFLFFIKKSSFYEYLISMLLSLLFVFFFKDKAIVPFVAITSLGIMYFNFKNSIATLFGNISYSLYLTHGLVGGAIVMFYREKFSNSIILLLALSGAIVFAILYYYFVERVFLNISKRIKYKK